MSWELEDEGFIFGKNLPHWKSALRPQTAELSLIPLSPKKDMKPTPTIHSVELEKFLKFSIDLHCLIPKKMGP